MSTRVSPLRPAERIVLIDALRGLAIFGIFMVNMQYMYEPMTKMLISSSQDAPIHQLISESFIKFFFEGKFYVIFSMLFGFGFWIFLNKSTSDGSSVVPVFRRRLFFLMLFGIAHIVLLWVGDILLYYTLLGFILILFKKASEKKIKKWIISLVLVPPVVITLLVSMIWALSQIPEAKEAMDSAFQESIHEITQFVEHTAAIYAKGSFSEIITVRIDEYLTLLPGTLTFFPIILGMFLLGVLFARKKLLTEYVNNLSFFKKVFWWGVGVGVPTNTLYTIASHYSILCIPDGWMLLTSIMHTFGGIAFGLSIISAMAILFAKGKSGWLSFLLAPVGRMALTNYLLQSIISAFLFYSHGLRLIGKVEAWQGIVLVIIIFSAQIVFSKWWLKRFRFGPFEWLWRSLTYGKIQPMKNNG
ncbi:MAG: DUF418 domain-containing protein [Bacteroidales bacterium]